jgi:hypothetical protein
VPFAFSELPVKTKQYNTSAFGPNLANTFGMKRWIVLALFVLTAACARKAEVRSPGFIRTDRYSYVTGDDGRLYIVATNPKDLDDALKTIKPGPSSVAKLDLWVVTPLQQRKKK